MKKNLLLLLLLTATVSSIAQIGFGAKAGLNRYVLSGEDQSYKHGLHAGAIAQIPVTPLFAIQPELIFSAEGNELIEDDDIFIAQKLGYINLPVMLQLTTKSGFYAEAGPQLGFLLSAKSTQTGRASVDIKSQLISTSISLGVGLGYRLKMGLGIGMRYNRGMTDIQKNSSMEPAKSNGVQIGLSYLYRQKPKKK